ncbi:hypothetical protein BU17DRAFT_100084 [Hysterangium stoloniferum]|nr:hypothetical protein BU17DRAFT_100084 [Hysterangium stoloniferum]
MKEMEKEDKELAKSLQVGATELLIFAGLFGAILPAFLIESRRICKWVLRDALPCLLGHFGLVLSAGLSPPRNRPPSLICERLPTQQVLQTTRPVLEMAENALRARRHASMSSRVATRREWIWVEDGTIPLEQATWYDEKSHAYKCPYGDCDTMFPRAELEARIPVEFNLPVAVEYGRWVSQPASVVDDVSDDDCEYGSAPERFAGTTRSPPNAAQTTPAFLMHAGKLTRPSEDLWFYTCIFGCPASAAIFPEFPICDHSASKVRPIFTVATALQPLSTRRALEAIATRLLVVPRPARVSTLRGELTNLNHKLPAEVCIPLWGHTSDAEATSSGGQLEPHHRVVRIPPRRERRLEFRTTSAENTEVLRKMALKEIGQQGGLSELPDCSTGPNTASSSTNPRYDAVQELLDVKEPGDVPTLGIVVPPTPRSSRGGGGGCG